MCKWTGFVAWPKFLLQSIHNNIPLQGECGDLCWKEWFRLAKLFAKRTIGGFGTNMRMQFVFVCATVRGVFCGCTLLQRSVLVTRTFCLNHFPDQSVMVQATIDVFTVLLGDNTDPSRNKLLDVNTDAYVVRSQVCFVSLTN